MDLRTTYKKIICVITLSTALFFNCNGQDIKVQSQSSAARPPLAKLIFGQIIPPEYADTLIDNYRRVIKSTYRLTTYHTTATKHEEVYSFYFRGTDILSLITNNASGEKPEKVVFTLGLEADGHGHYLHLITYGMHHAILLEGKLSPNQNTYSILDNLPFFDSDPHYKNFFTDPQPAKDLRASFNSNAHTIFDGGPVSGTNKYDNALWTGFSFDSDQITEIINDNAALEKDKNADNLVLKLGIFITRKPHHPRQSYFKWHVIAYGTKIDNGAEILLDGRDPNDPTQQNPNPAYRVQRRNADNSLRPPSVFDKADPYPPK